MRSQSVSLISFQTWTAMIPSAALGRHKVLGDHLEAIRRLLSVKILGRFGKHSEKTAPDVSRTLAALAKALAIL
jgi:hypothetical protein